MSYELTDEQYADLCAVFGVPADVRRDFNEWRAKDETCTGGGSVDR